jgi:hypothetical protein
MRERITRSKGSSQETSMRRTFRDGEVVEAFVEDHVTGTTDVMAMGIKVENIA